MTTGQRPEPVPGTFLDMQAHVGITKHIGGLEATEELLSLCHAEEAAQVLNVGCGIGVGSIHVARKFGSHVTGLDLSDRMVAWSRLRAREDGVEDRVTFLAGNVLDLPFEDGRFDVVFAESVLIFVEDKARAIRECVRVTKPGGHVGINEGFWMEPPPSRMLELAREAIGPCVPDLEEWLGLWNSSGLRERVVRTYPVDSRSEVKSRIRWIGWRWLLRAWIRALRLYASDPSVRQIMRRQLDVPAEVFRYLGYGLFAGKKPEGDLL